MALRPQTDALRGSLDLLVLTTLSLTPMHRWGISPRARYYRLTASGRRALGAEIESWRRFAVGLEAVLRTST